MRGAKNHSHVRVGNCSRNVSPSLCRDVGYSSVELDSAVICGIVLHNHGLFCDPCAFR
jgi:hypothetical protein